MLTADYENFKLDLSRGNYKKVINSGLQSLIDIKVTFLVIEAYLELEDINSAYSLINDVKKKSLGIEDEIFIYYYTARYYYIKNNYSVSLENIEKGLGLINQIKEKNLIEALFFTVKSEVLWHQGKLEEAQGFANIGVELLEKANNQYYLAIALNVLGMIYRGRGFFSEALKVHERALVLREKLDNPQHIANSLNNIGVVYWTTGKLKIALSYLERALALKDKVENKKNIANWINNIAIIKDSQGFLYDALKMYSEALSLFEKANNLPAIATIYSNIGDVYRNLGLLFEAKNKHQQALGLRMKIGNPYFIAESIFYVTLVKFEMAIPINNKEIEETFPKPPFDSYAINAYFNMIQGLIARQNEQLNDALQYWREALNIGGLEFYLQNLCHEHIVLLTFSQWIINPSLQLKEKFKNRLNNWKDLCKENNLVSSLCKVFLIEAKLRITDFQYENAESLLNLCTTCAKENDLNQYAKLAEVELSNLKKLKDQSNKLNIYDISRIEKIQFDEILLYIKNITKVFEHHKIFYKLS